MENKQNVPIKTYLLIIVTLITGLTLGFLLSKSGKEQNSIALVNYNIEDSIEKIETKNKYIYEDFEYYAAQNPLKNNPWLYKAKELREETNKIYNHIERIKRYMPETNTTTEKRVELQKALNNYTHFLLNLHSYSSEENRKIFSSDNTQWLADMSPIAAKTALSKIQLDIKNNETMALLYLKVQPTAGDYKVNSLEAIVIPKSTNIRLGEKYSAQIGLIAQDSTKRPQIFINGKDIEDGLYEIRPTSTGTFTYKGELLIQCEDGRTKMFPFESSYTVKP